MDTQNKTRLLQVKRFVDNNIKIFVICQTQDTIVEDLAKELQEFNPSFVVSNSLNSIDKIFSKNKFNAIITFAKDLDYNIILDAIQDSEFNYACPVFVIGNELEDFRIINVEEQNIYSDFKRKLLRTLYIQNKQIHQVSNREKFLAITTHDLKTPINSAITVLKLLLGGGFGEISPEQYELFVNMLNSNYFMKQLVENILCNDKIKNNKLEIYKKEANLDETINEAIKLTENITASKQQKIIYKNTAKDSNAEYDFLEIKRVIMNLISNASDYSPEKTNIEVNLFDDTNFLYVSVIDNGKGLDAELLHNIFDPHVTYAKKYNKIGSGLGLYISKKIIDAHNGIIKFENENNKGAKITFSIPK